MVKNVPVFFASLLTAFKLVSGSAPALAQDFPTKPIQLVTAEAGGGLDVLCRLIAKVAGPSIGQPMIVINRAGIDVEMSVVRAAADGHTLLVRGSTMWTQPFLRVHVPYDPQRDFVPISVVATFPSVLVVTPALPVKSVQELIAYAKSHPGELNYASSVTGTIPHLAAELFMAMTDTRITRINYRGNAPAIADVMNGRVQIMIPTAGVVGPHLASEKLRALAVTSAMPSTLFPDLPTVAAAVPGFEADSMSAVFAPAKTPQTIVNRLNREIVRAVNTNEVKGALLKTGVEAIGSTPQEMAAKLKSEMVKWAKVIKDAGIREDN